MCTAATYKAEDFFFGRNLDYYFTYGEEVVLTPRHFPLNFGAAGIQDTHYAILGMAHVAGGYPLYYDACNEKGLCMAGLNFVLSACYFPPDANKDNIAQYNFIPWILGQCENVTQARALLANLNLTGDPFSPKLPTAKLHWIIADRDSCITVESVAEGLKVYDNPAGVLSNEPAFPMQVYNLNNFMHLSAGEPGGNFAPELPLLRYSQGMGAMGLPGDLSSMSRFVRAAFTRNNSESDPGQGLGQIFRILDIVSQTQGCCRLPDGQREKTIYTGCMNADKGIYYYTTYTNQRITGVDMHRENLDGSELRCFPLVTEQDVHLVN